jgi:hypothetical protein
MKPAHPERGAGSPAAFVQLGSIPLDPSEDGGMVNTQSAFLHELFHISVTHGIAQVPTDAEQNHFAFKMLPFEQCRHLNGEGLLLAGLR